MLTLCYLHIITAAGDCRGNGFDTACPQYLKLWRIGSGCSGCIAEYSETSLPAAGGRCRLQGWPRGREYILLLHFLSVPVHFFSYFSLYKKICLAKPIIRKFPQNPSLRLAKHSEIVIRGARVHNLKNINLTLPRNKLIVMTGVSGSGKSSLAFDTIYSEGQRRYVESLSSYARQFLERMEKPDVDLIQGISPAIAIEQKTTSRNPRSTVATTTEIYDYLRLLFGRAGRTFCRVCGKPVRRESVSTAVDSILQEPEGSKFYVMFPLHDHPGQADKRKKSHFSSSADFSV